MDNAYPSRSRPPVLVGILLLLTVLAACGPAYSLVIMNRSGTTVALFPGMVIPPCSQAGYTAAQIREAQDAGVVRAMAEDDSWIPDGAIHWVIGWEPQRIGAAKPQIVIVSGVAMPAPFDGAAPADAIPACGGVPVGVSEDTMP